MIISVSRRTDIPAFYSEWFYRRMEDGFFMVRNPMNPRQVSRVSVSPQNVESIVFWTKNPSDDFISNLRRLDELGYRYYFQFTVTSYARDMEKNVPPKKQVIEKFQRLSRQIGKEKIIWRYDPVILTEKYTMDYHAKYFDFLAEKLHDYTEKVIISFVDSYPKIQKRLGEGHISELNEDQMRTLALSFKETARKHGLGIESCAEKIDLDDMGIAHGHCIDGGLINRICNKEYVFSRDKSQREGCGCMVSIDIGAYNTCLHNCTYCYAIWNYKSSDKIRPDNSSPLLCSVLTADDKITDREAPKLKEKNPELFP
ncbi:MAG: DUF1848 domain-containing protein [Spirochaetales bacterium]|nr:DUF1848 domain-containing protein [Spirochaetales bacterium]